MTKKWTHQETEYLKESIGLVKKTTIAKKLDLPISSVERKLRGLGLGNTREQCGMLTIGALSKLIHVDRTIIKSWTEKNGLKVVKKITSKKRMFCFINAEDFWDWAKENKDKVDFAKIERFSIIPEPEWVQEARINNPDFQEKKYKTWTTKEDRRVRELREQSTPFKEIAEELGRTTTSVYKRYNRIKRSFESTTGHVNGM